MLWNLFALAACCAVYFGARGIMREHRWLQQARIAPGTVTELVYHRGSKTGSYRPRVQYQAADGHLASFESSAGANPPDFQIGEGVTVAYNAEPGSARIVTYEHRYGGWVFLIGLGAFVLILRVAALVGTFLVPHIYLHGTGGG